jgi:biopolymer transport protein ExbD
VKAPAKPGNYKARPAMNVTPLVDVVLVLLIIFMVVIPALEQGTNIQVPGIRNVDEKTQGPPPFMLAVSRDGELFLEEERLPLADLEARLKAASRREPSRRLVLRGDKGTSYGVIRRVYRTAQSVGFPGVSLRVNHRRDEVASAM